MTNLLWSYCKLALVVGTIAVKPSINWNGLEGNANSRRRISLEAIWCFRKHRSDETAKYYNCNVSKLGCSKEWGAMSTGGPWTKARQCLWQISVRRDGTRKLPRFSVLVQQSESHPRSLSFYFLSIVSSSFLPIVSTSLICFCFFSTFSFFVYS